MLKAIRAKNFKSLRNFELALGPQMNLLVGPNMGGKSNVLDLLRFLHESWFPQPGTYGPVNALARRGGIEEVLWKGSPDRLLSVAVEFADPSRPGSGLLYELEIVAGAAGYVNIQAERLKLEVDDKCWPLIVRDDNGRWLANSNSEKIVSIPPQQSAMELAPPNWDGYPLKVFAQNWRFYQLVPSRMRQANQVSVGGVLEPDGWNLSAWLMWLQTRSPESFARIAEVVRDVFPEVTTLLTWPTQQGTVFLSSEERGLRRPTPLIQMSDGELVFIALLSLICAPDELSGTLFLVEELENSLHPKLLGTLIGLLRQVQQEILDRRAVASQIIATTHSPFVLDQLKIDEVIWVQKMDGETKAVRPGERAYLKQLVQDEELGLGDLMFSGALGGDQ